MPPLPAAGVPARVAVPLPLSVKVTPPGRRTGLTQGGRREAASVVTVKVPAVPTVKVVLLAAGDRRRLVAP